MVIKYGIKRLSTVIDFQGIGKGYSYLNQNVMFDWTADITGDRSEYIVESD